MITSQLEKAINNQINQEFSAAYTYLGMSIYFDQEGLDGFASWMQNQCSEEQAHAMKLLNYLQDRGGNVQLLPIARPVSEYNSPLEVFQTSLRLECENTASIHKLYSLAAELDDYSTQTHLQWFLDEQVEEEKSMEDIIVLLKRVENNTAGLLYLNDKLGARKDEE